MVLHEMTQERIVTVRQSDNCVQVSTGQRTNFRRKRTSQRVSQFTVTLVEWLATMICGEGVTLQMWRLQYFSRNAWVRPWYPCAASSCALLGCSLSGSAAGRIRTHTGYRIDRVCLGNAVSVNNSSWTFVGSMGNLVARWYRRWLQAVVVFDTLDSEEQNKNLNLQLCKWR